VARTRTMQRGCRCRFGLYTAMLIRDNSSSGLEEAVPLLQ
jgi:hypothetical protein